MSKFKINDAVQNFAAPSEVLSITAIADNYYTAISPGGKEYKLSIAEADKCYVKNKKEYNRQLEKIEAPMIDQNYDKNGFPTYFPE